MKVEQLLPTAAWVELDELLGAGGRASSFGPFADAALDFCADLSLRLARDSDARRHPELQALAFWMRKAELERLRQDFLDLQRRNAVLVPLGTVFHVPPSNVDTIFVYSWLLSVLAGNLNIVRLSSRRSDAVDTILRVMADALADADDGRLERATRMITYGHDDEVTAAISAAVDGRIIWGGDETVQAIRAVPLAPHAREMAFPDRYSYAAIAAAPYLDLEESERDELTHQFFNDAYWFNQLGCSSPTFVMWCGEPTASATASDDFFTRLARLTRERGYSIELGHVLNKNLSVHELAIEKPIAGSRWYSNEVVVTTLADLRLDRRHRPGGGYFLQYFAAELNELVPFVESRDQTLSYFGFGAGELRSLARSVNGRGIDRMVPIGQALIFNRFWDGLDLLQALTKWVYLESGKLPK